MNLTLFCAAAEKIKREKIACAAANGFWSIKNDAKAARLSKKS
jgi:hypothetical protein